ncbi:MAG: CPBP family intramembrane glutamic endopeptidase [Gemmatimonas sp.]
MLTRQSTSPAPASLLYGPGGNLRAVWRIGVFVCVYFVVWDVMGATAAPALAFVSGKVGGVIPTNECLDLLTALITVGFVLHMVDRQTWAVVGFTEGAWRPTLLLRAAALGASAIAITAGVLALSGHLQFAPDTMSTFLSGDSVGRSPTGAWASSTLRISLLLAPAALFEEVIFRGYLWRIAEDSASPRVALVVSSVMFGVAHIQNPGADLLAIGNVMLAGVALGLLRWLTNSLPAAWAAHFAWNWIMAAALHVPVSGLPMSTPGYRAVIDGPAWLAGGSWGPEGGVVATFVLLAAVAFGLYSSRFLKSSINFPRRASSTTVARSA